MSRVHQGAIHRRHGANNNAPSSGRRGGIFSLSTPFVRDAAAASSSSSAAGANNMLLLASVAASSRIDDQARAEDDDDHDAASSKGAGADEVAGGRRFGDGMEDGDLDGESSGVTVLGDDGIDDEGGAAIERNNGDEDDDDDDENFSIDLLADEGGGDDIKYGVDAVDRRVRLGGNNDDTNGRPRRKRDNNHENHRDRHRANIASTSPATQTLDRLAMFGSQEGGAELVIHLLAANYANDDDDADQAVEVDVPSSHAAINTATSVNGDANGARRNIDDEKMNANDERDVEMANASGSGTMRVGGMVDATTTTSATVVAVKSDHVDDDNHRTMEKRRLCLRTLKGYFMSTKNSSEYAARRQKAKRDHGSGAGVVLPPDFTVPFCRRCNHPTPTARWNASTTAAAAAPTHVPPHHGLCPFHDDFYNSGSYEILNLIVDGNLLSCEACIYQFHNGRLNKKLCHVDGCERKKKTRPGDKQKSGDGNSNMNPGDGASNCGSVHVNDEDFRDKSDQKERRRCDGDVNGKKNTAAGRGTGCHSKMSSPAVAWMGAGNDVRITRRASSQVTQTSETKTKADIVNKSSIDQSSQSTVMERGPPFEVGTVVFVRDRTWPGRNDPGGVARIVKVHRPKDEDDDEYDGDDQTTYDVKYVLESRREKYLEERFLSLHAMLNAYVSPSKNDYDSGVVRLENKDVSMQSSGVANDDDSNTVEVAFCSEGSSFGVGANGSNEAISSSDHVDADGHPLSEYERLRLRNIQRNKSRLAQLGLLVPPGKISGQTSSSSLGTKGGKRKARHEPCGVEIERRTQPKRQTATNRPKGDVMPKVSIDTSAADSRDDKNQGDKTSLAKVGGSGQGDVDQRQTLPKIMMEVDYDRVKQSKQALTSHRVCDAVVANLPTVTIADASKTGCRKCMLELKAMKIDSRANHDVCCPRAAKTAPPSNDEYQVNLAELIPYGHIEQIQCEHNQPTPSPISPRRKKDSTAQQRPPSHRTPLPRWINDFILESNRHNETVPAPRGSKWFPCPNPWGKIGHEDGDFVIISPFQSETARDLLSIFHQGPNGNSIPKRFVANPLQRGSPYHSTHRSPARGGYSALRLLRDRTSLRPWGFTVRLHEFGGACLVKSIEPLSPAEAAVDISGWTDESSSSGLKLHDMIICINGKSIGNLTMTELLIEFDVCGPEMMLVVSRFDILERDANREMTTLEDLAMDWNDIGAGATFGRNMVSFGDDYNSGELCELDDQPSAKGGETEECEMDGAESETCINHVDSSNNSAKTEQQLTRDEKSDVPRRRPAPAHHESLSMASKVVPIVSLSKAAESGCKKCKLELKTGIKGSQSHCPSCPRKGKQRSSKKDSIHECAQICRIAKKHLIDSSLEEKNRQMECDGNLTVHDLQACGNFKPNKIIRKHPATRYQKQLDNQSDDECDILPIRRLSIKDSNNSALQQNAETATEVPIEKRDNNLPSNDWIDNDSSSLSIAEDECESHDDENPWLGCVCGKTHPHPIKVFWVQCESCDAWYNVAEECVGFDELAAENIDKWCCWACDPPVAGLGL